VGEKKVTNLEKEFRVKKKRKSSPRVKRTTLTVKAGQDREGGKKHILQAKRMSWAVTRGVPKKNKPPHTGAAKKSSYLKEKKVEKKSHAKETARN